MFWIVLDHYNFSKPGVYLKTTYLIQRQTHLLHFVLIIDWASRAVNICLSSFGDIVLPIPSICHCYFLVHQHRSVEPTLLSFRRSLQLKYKSHIFLKGWRQEKICIFGQSSLVCSFITTITMNCHKTHPFITINGISLFFGKLILRFTSILFFCLKASFKLHFWFKSIEILDQMTALWKILKI